MKFDHLMISFFACLTLVMNFLLGIALLKFLKMTGHVNLLSHFLWNSNFFTVYYTQLIVRRENYKAISLEQ